MGEFTQLYLHWDDTESFQGADDVQGALNHITNATILAARDEIKLGRAINLK
jgi:hypothetical protein